MSEYIATCCSNCFAMVYIVDGKTFADPQKNSIVNCWNCGHRLTVPPALRTQNETLKENYNAWDDLDGKDGKEMSGEKESLEKRLAHLEKMLAEINESIKSSVGTNKAELYASKTFFETSIANIKEQLKRWE